jgi:hypothetical protein
MFGKKGIQQSLGSPEVQTFQRADRLGEINQAALSRKIEQSQGAGDTKASSLGDSEGFPLID